MVVVVVVVVDLIVYVCVIDWSNEILKKGVSDWCLTDTHNTNVTDRAIILPACSFSLIWPIMLVYYFGQSSNDFGHQKRCVNEYVLLSNNGWR